MMKKQIPFVVITVFALYAAVRAEVYQQWTFEFDRNGTVLADALNNGTGAAAFEDGGAGTLEADGMGALSSTPSASALWENGAELDADIGDQSSGTLFLRYDLTYDWTSESNTVGSTIGLSFVDSSGTNITGFALVCRPSDASDPTDKTFVPVGHELELSGTLSAIAKVDLSAGEITVWYDTTGSNSFAEGSPSAVEPISITSVDQLRIQATGLSPGDSTDFIDVENIRVADSWSDITDSIASTTSEQYLNEWMFDRDLEGRTLSEAVNSGTDGAVFSPDTNGVTRTDGRNHLICSNNVDGVGDLWADGAVLRADVTNQTFGVRYLRYDFEYDVTAAENDSGTLLELAFADSSSTNLAGIYLKYDSDSTPPEGLDYIPVVSDLELTGEVTVIARVDLDSQTMDVWYDLSGNRAFVPDLNTPDASEGIDLTSIEQLQFRATGDFVASPSNDCVRIDNIRTAVSWEEIIAPVVDLEADPLLTEDISASLGTQMGVGQTNRISVSILNSGAVASNVTSVLSYSGTSGGLSILAVSNAPVVLTNGASTVNIYDVVGSADGEYVLTVQVFADGVTNSPVTLDLVVGPSVSDSALTLLVAPGQIASASVTLANDGTLDEQFVVSTEDTLPLCYAVEATSISRRSFWFSDPVFDDWTGTDSDPLDMDFGLTLHGIEYTSFSASQYGFLTLSNANGDTAKLSVFETNGTVAQDTIRYDYISDYLLVAWGNGTGKEFQLRLHSDGTFEYLYQQASWGDGEIGLTADLTSGDTVSQTFDHVPGLVGMDAISMSAEIWVSYSPSSGMLDGYGSSRSLVFTADATSIQEPADYKFTALVDWGGVSNKVVVTVKVETNRYELSVPSSFAFSGPAGSVSPTAALMITNSGNVPLTYHIVDDGLQSASYTSAPAAYQWIHIPETQSTALDESDLGSESVAIGFPFVFFGSTYTSLTVGVDGTLTFDDETSIVPYSARLSYDRGASVRFLTDAGRTRLAVTWENMAQPGGGEEQTFQAILNRSGSIRFNYQFLGEGWTNGTIGVYGSDSVTETLIGEDTIDSIEDIPITEITYVTSTIGNYTQIKEVETVIGMSTVTNYTASVSRQSLEFVPGQPRIITYSPVGGSLSVGQTAIISLKGNATGLTDDGSNDVDFSTDLTFNYEGGSPSVGVTFTATNSVEVAYPAFSATALAIAAATWGTDDPVVSSTLNPDGSRTLSWPAAEDNESRVYSVWYTTDLCDGWTLLGSVTNATGYLDDEHMNEPVIFYKAKVVWQ